MMRSAPRRRQSPLVAAAVVVLLVLALALAGRHWIAQPFRVPSASMQPGLQTGDVILADRTARGQAQRGDVVVFDGRGYFTPAGGDGHYWVKRVIGVGGDDVRIRNGALFVNGEEIAEPYLPEGVSAGEVDVHVEVPVGRLFLLGDNRADSTDSRSFLGAPGGGMVPVERVVGRAERIIWPLGRAGAVPASVSSAERPVPSDAVTLSAAGGSPWVPSALGLGCVR